MDWLEITATTTDPTTAEVLEAELAAFAQGDEGVASQQLGDPEAIDPSTLRPEIAVKLFVRGERDASDLRDDIARHLGALDLPLPDLSLIHI